ncbi:MAG TPA: hypothetical protein VE961_07430 [Pyrinomonadaceae bacterium]|nr:hypothetical protein [Pyrinomonadaceae bacterium]
MFDAIILILLGLGFYLLAAVPLSLPAWYFGRRRARFRWWELSVFLVPLVIWLIFFLASTTKSLGNLIEVVILGLSVPLAVLIRIVVGRAVPNAVIAGLLLILLCSVAVLLGVMYPKVDFQIFH